MQLVSHNKHSLSPLQKPNRLIVHEASLKLFLLE